MLIFHRSYQSQTRVQSPRHELPDQSWQAGHGLRLRGRDYREGVQVHGVGLRSGQETALARAGAAQL